MCAQEQPRAGHGPYIEAVRGSIEARDIRVTAVACAISADDRREATLTLRPDQIAFADGVPAEASACWDEDDGWSMLVRHQSLGSCVHKGLEVLPDPQDVAAWAAVLLAHPELTPSYEDHPFREHSVADPDFEARLARYATSP
jgi:hypothetical protein